MPEERKLNENLKPEGIFDVIFGPQTSLEVSPRRKTTSKLFTDLGKTLSAVSIGLKGGDPSSLFDDRDDDLSRQIQLATLGNLTGGESGARAAIGLGTPPKEVRSPQSVPSLDDFLRVSGGDPNLAKQLQSLVKSQRDLEKDTVEGAEEQGRIKGITESLAQREKSINERLTNAELSSKDFIPFMKTFQLSQAELTDKFGEEIGETNIAGFGLRQIAKFQQATGALPETQAFRDSIQAFATPLAKTAGEDRLTNEDIQRFTKLLGDTLSGPKETNINKFRNELIRLRDTRGADISTILNVLNESGGVLKEVSEKTEAFDTDVKDAGKSLDSISVDELKNLSIEELRRLAK